MSRHSTLSLGACVVTRNQYRFDDLDLPNLVFYAEMKPDSLEYEEDALRVGCSQLQCLEKVATKAPAYNCHSPEFNGGVTLQLIREVALTPAQAMVAFADWLRFQCQHGRHGDFRLVPVVDTLFFDPSRFALLADRHLGHNPFGWYGIELHSLVRGRYGEETTLTDLVPDDRAKPHRADHDAAYLARIAAKLLF